MNGRRLIACLAGDGVGPELMAEATRALARLSTLHSLPLDELHLPFAGEAVTRYGHPLPASTRAAYRDADAILVATPQEPALEALKATSTCLARDARARPAARRRARLRAVSSAPPEAAIERAFFSAASKRGRSRPSAPRRPGARPSRQSAPGWDGLVVEHRRSARRSCTCARRTTTRR